MWGGLKARTAYGEIFRRWSATKPIEEVRQGLFKEPRPWHLLFSLHEHRHFLSDHQCSRLLSWCATTIQLARSVEEKGHAYRLTQESFNVLLHSHGVANLSFLEYMRICAAGNDLTAAYRLYQYWLESSRPEAGCLLHLSWLAQLGLITPSTEKAEDMGLAVMEQYMAHHYHPQSHSALSCPSTAGEGGASSPEHHRKTLFACLKGLQSRVQNPVLLDFIDKLPLSEEDALAHLKSLGWPHQAHHHTFPNLEGGVAPSVVSVDFPALRDSILHPVLIQRLESAAFTEKNVEKVIALLQYFQQRIQKEKSLKEMIGSNSPPRAAASREPDIWRQLHDASAVQFRKKIIDAGGLTPELYHYVVVALSSTKPSAALRTMQRMQAAKLRVLDLTRAVLIIATSGSLKDQVQLFSDQMKEISFREQLDLDHDTNTHLEAFWKFDYTTFFHYQNALNKKAFLLFLIKGLGPVAVQRIWRSYLMREDKNATLDGSDDDEWNMLDLVIMEPCFREAVVKYMESQYGDSHVQKCLDDITHFIPKLDISLIGSFPHFEAYAVPQQAMEDIATDMCALRQKLSSFTCIYLVDTSFVETSEEGIFRLGRHEQAGSAHSVWNGEVRQPSTSTTETAPQERSLILFPYRVLQQLANTVTEASSPASVSLDPALQEDIQEEVVLASQRLRAVFSMIHQSYSAAVSAVPEEEKDREPQHTAQKISSQISNSNRNAFNLAPSFPVDASASDVMKLADGKKRSTALPSVSVRVLHFTECLLSQVVGLEALKSTFDLHPDQSENDRLLLVVSLIRTAAPPNCRVVLCSDDVELNIKLEDLAQTHPPGVVQQLFPAEVELLSTPIPDHVVNEEKSILVDDNPVLDLDLEDFSPHLHAPPPAPAAEAEADDVNAAAAAAAAVVVFPSTEKPKEDSGETKLFSEGSIMIAADEGGGAADFSDSPWLRLLEEDGDPPITESEEGRGGTIISANHHSESILWAERHTEGEDMVLHESSNNSNKSNNNPYNTDQEEISSLPRTSGEASPSLTTASASPSPRVTTTGALMSPERAKNGEQGDADRVDGDALLTTYASPHDVTPIATHVVQASTVHSVFHEFDVLEPEEVFEREAARAARRTQLSPDGDSHRGGEKGPSARSFSALMKDTLSHRGYSRRLRARMARRLSNQSGGRVPFNLRYQVVEANVHDPRNRHLLDIYRRGVKRKREEFHRKWQE